jgi:hypothetical protein
MESEAETEIKPMLVTSQLLTQICVDSFTECLTCRKVAEAKLAAKNTICLTASPTADRSGLGDKRRWIKDKQSDTKVTLS